MYALGVTCPTSLLLNLEDFIFAEVIQKHSDWQARFRLNDEKQLSKPGGNIRNIKQIYSSYVGSPGSAVTTYNMLYTFAFLRNSIQQLIAFRTNPETELQ